jgi:ElaA protein
MEWKCSEFRHLTAHELYSILRARSSVFVVEYAHIHLDIDDKDDAALHVFALEPGPDSPQIAAYARLLPGDEQDPEVVIDKVLTTPKRRDDDTHDLLVTHTMAAAQTVWPNHPIHISVATHQEAFYESFGFRKAVGPFLEHGIPYIGMAWRDPETSQASELNRLAEQLGLVPSHLPDFVEDISSELNDQQRATQ